MFRFLAGHTGNRDTVGELGDKGDDFVMLRGGKRRDFGKTERAAKLLAQRNRFRRVFFGGRHDIIGAAEDCIVAVFDAGYLASRHGMRRDEFHVGAEHVLHRFDDAAFDAGDVGDDRAGFEILLIFADPVDENMRI